MLDAEGSPAHIRMPEECRGKEGSQILHALGMNHVNILQAFSKRDRRRSMLVQRAEVATKFTLSVDIEVVLVTEEDHTTDSNQPGKVVLLEIRELRQAYSMYLRAYFWVVVENVCGGGEQVVELRVSQQALVVIGHFLKGWPVNVGESWEKVVVLVILVGIDTRSTRLITQRVQRFPTNRLRNTWILG